MDMLHELGREEGKPSKKKEKAKKMRINGHVEDDEELRKMKRYLVGDMATVCNISNIKTRMQKCNLGDIEVQRMGGKNLLLNLEDGELFMMLEDLEWSYLKEIFSVVGTWSESLYRLDRAIWIELSSIPLHYWNETTLGRVVKLWDSIEALGENMKHTLDREMVTTSIIANQVERIDVEVETEVGNTLYYISVTEIGFSDNSRKPET
ncbi:hypothetical protein V6N13_059682 [Hibiscus sabdariffa]